MYPSSWRMCPATHTADCFPGTAPWTPRRRVKPQVQELTPAPQRVHLRSALGLPGLLRQPRARSAMGPPTRSFTLALTSNPPPVFRPCLLSIHSSPPAHFHKAFQTSGPVHQNVPQLSNRSHASKGSRCPLIYSATCGQRDHPNV